MGKNWFNKLDCCCCYYECWTGDTDFIHRRNGDRLNNNKNTVNESWKLIGYKQKIDVAVAVVVETLESVNLNLKWCCFLNQLTIGNI